MPKKVTIFLWYDKEMKFKELERFEKLALRKQSLSGYDRITPDEEIELEELRGKIFENAGESSSNAGFVVVSNYKWIYKPYLELIEAGQMEKDTGLEEQIYWEALKLIEEHVGENGSRKLINEDYFRVLSHFLQANLISGIWKNDKEWLAEPITGKWGILRKRLREKVLELSRERIGESLGVLGTKVEDRIEPIFNKVLKVINKELDSNHLSSEEAIKLFNKLSGLMAEIKGEKVKNDGVQVTHNNVFVKILNEKRPEDREKLRGEAIELLEGEGYMLG